MSSIPSFDPKVLLAAVWAVALISPLHGAASYIASPPPRDATVPAAYAFGDSIVDPGNNNGLATVAKCNFPPYGRDLDQGVPMGRFSNGRVPSDMLAEKLGVKKLLPAYLDPNLELQDLLTGVSFASGANGYDPLSAELIMVLSLSDQLDFYSKYMETVRSEVGEERASAIASESLYIVCSGANDITNTYFATPLRRFEYDISSYTDLMVGSASSFLRELYGLGARRIGVLSLPPVGCIPSQRTLHGGPERDCFDPANEVAILFNSKLSAEIDSLNEDLPGARLVYVDIYYPLLAIIQDPARFGFKVSTKGCCGTGNIEVSYLCNRLDHPDTCGNDTEFVFWDSFHPTEAAYHILVDQIFSKYARKMF
ncbi:GDSL esterase/lipase EXL3-like isoform X3 [Rhodamnia argentea]|uniref:GDSL esterase/lipase EXL3-like isoform X2 n=1 Tax=Rhodamnia argentea TaxID=178133 RepID=A0ABM3GW52_9MYRT|nr:GDSL esterase/lipase EXL3-like isoform X2 [Rhodamnia argentea]XP_048128591.1 GDSL esterase/lipase EXL3-like isoform X3 [Rhodamnia argentea]